MAVTPGVHHQTSQPQEVLYQTPLVQCQHHHLDHVPHQKTMLINLKAIQILLHQKEVYMYI